MPSVPTGSIVWMSADEGVVRGRESKKIIRKNQLPLGET